MNGCVLVCRHCGWQTVCGTEQIAQRLRTLGLLRRAPHPPPELVDQLLRANLHRLACDVCQAQGLTVATDDADSASSPHNDWQQAVLCRVCHRPIPPERLEVFPDVQTCVACQDSEERGRTPAEPDYCPKCGAALELRVSHAGGVTRYKQFCTGDPPCRL